MASELATGSPLFIVGMPRSGTKLLRGILNQHPGVVIVEIETEFFPFWVNHWSRHGDLSDYAQFLRFAEKFHSYPFYRYLSSRSTEPDSKLWYDMCKTYEPADVFEALLKTVTGFVPGRHLVWGDKSPSYLRHIDLLRQHFPNARFIHIVRDVRDYCLSIHRAWGKSMLRAAQRWNDDVASAHSVGTDNDDYFELRYEDLLSNPESEVQDICAFLKISFDSDMLETSTSTENIGDARGTKGILRSNSQKYMTDLDPKKRREIESIAAGSLRLFEYECPDDIRPSRISPPTLTVLKLLDGFSLFKSSIRERGVIGSIQFLFRYNQVSGNRQGRER